MDGDLLPRCPECGALMRQANRGLTFKKRGPAFICPIAERNTLHDRTGQPFRLSGDRHTGLHLWHPDELGEAAWVRGGDRRWDQSAAVGGPDRLRTEGGAHSSLEDREAGQSFVGL